MIEADEKENSELMMEGTSFFFSKRLQSLRKEKGLSQEALGKELNISRLTISNYEQGRREPNFTTLRVIANFFNVSSDYLIGRTESTVDEANNIDEIFPERIFKFVVTPEQADIIQRYLDLDERGKDAVAVHIDYEYENYRPKKATRYHIANGIFTPFIIDNIERQE